MAITPNLNDDVLDQIFRACPASSLAVISLVSSHIRMLALPHLLRMVSFDRNPQEIYTCLDFIVNNTQSRKVEDPQFGPQIEIYGVGRYILQLELTGHILEEPEYPIPTLAPILTRALALMPNLHSIVIEGLVEEIVFHSSNFALTVFSRPQLTYIELCGVGPLASNHFGQALKLKKDFMKLKTVKLRPHEDTYKDLELISGEGMGSVVFHSRGNLTKLSFMRCDLRNLLHYDASGQGGDIKTPVTFPKVVSLSLNRCKVSLKDLANAFPALRTLILGFAPFLLESTHSQTQTISFLNLTSIQGRYKDLRAFLQSTVGHGHMRRVVVDFPWTSDDDGTTPFSVTLALPMLKVLHFTHKEIMPLLWWKAFVQTAPHLTYLAVEVQPEHAVENMLDLLYTQVPRVLAECSPLAYISLTFKGRKFAVDDDASSERQSLSAIALSYATNIPTLKYVDICKETKLFTRIAGWWSVVRCGSVSGDVVDVQLKALSECEGKAMRSWYDMET